RQLNRLQTAATSNGYFRAQLAAKLNFFSLAPDAALDTHRFNQSQLVFIKSQLIDLIRPRKLAAGFFQFFELNPHIETPWRVIVRIRGHRTKSLIIAGDAALSKRSPREFRVQPSGCS